MTKAIQNNVFSNITQLGMPESKAIDTSNGAFTSSFDQARENLVTGARQNIQNGSKHKTSNTKLSTNNFNELIKNKKIETPTINSSNTTTSVTKTNKSSNQNGVSKKKEKNNPKSSKTENDNKVNKQDNNKNEKIDTDKNDTNTNDVAKTEDIQNQEVKQSAKGQETTDAKELENVKEEKIKAVLADELEVPIEAINQILAQMNLTPTDLVDNQNFSNFINQTLEFKEVALVDLDASQVKEIAQLFDTINTIEQTPDANSIDISSMTPSNTESTAQVFDSEILVQTDGANASVQAVMTSEIVETPGNPAINTDTSDTDGENVNIIGNVQTRNTTADQGTVPIHNFSLTAEARNYNYNTNVSGNFTTRDIITENEFIEQIDFNELNDTRELDISLRPKELGRMNIKVTEQNGMLVAQIRVENERARQVINDNIEALRENLENQGLNITDVSVDINNNGDMARQQMMRESQKSSTRIQEIINNIEAEEAQTEEVPPTLTRHEVDYRV